jgi:hypothetical protein
MGARSGQRLLHYELTQGIIDAFYTVYNELGYGATASWKRYMKMPWSTSYVSEAIRSNNKR